MPFLLSRSHPQEEGGQGLGLAYKGTCTEDQGPDGEWCAETGGGNHARSSSAPSPLPIPPDLLEQGAGCWHFIKESSEFSGGG